MGLRNQLRELWIDFKYRRGWMTKEDVVRELAGKRDTILDQFPKSAHADRDEIRALLAETDSLSSIKDLGSFFEKTTEVQRRMEMVLAKHGDQMSADLKQKVGYVAGVDTMGYRPSGAHAWRFFINPFAVFTFYAEQHWATKAAINIIMTEVQHDGFTLDYDQSVPPERVAYVEGVIKKLGIAKLRLNILRHYLVYGNVIIRPHKNPFQQIKKFEILVMDRTMPQFDKGMERLVGWDYWTGYHSQLIPVEDVLHLGISSLKYPDLGVPLLSPLIVDIESDMSASALNNEIMKKAGMIGTIIVTKTDPSSGVNTKNSDRLTRRLQKEIQMQYAGIKGGQGALVSNYIDKVLKVTEIGGFEGNFLKLRTEIATAVCVVLDVPCERICINRSGKVYQASVVEDSIQASFDKSIAAKMDSVDEYINEQLLVRTLGITDVKIKANGRHGSLTINGARVGYIASQTGGLFTYDQIITHFYGLPALAPNDPRKWEIADNSKNRDKEVSPPRFAMPTTPAPQILAESPDDDDDADPEDDDTLE